MRKHVKARRGGLGGSVLLFAAAGAAGAVFTSSPADARPGFPGGPLCGWSAVWTCEMPDGSERTVVGTQCDIARFEARTGASCSLN